MGITIALTTAAIDNPQEILVFFLSATWSPRSLADWAYIIFNEQYNTKIVNILMF